VTRFLLDTNAVIGLLNDPTSKLARRVRRHSPSDIAISAIVLHELYFGAFNSQRATQNVALVDSLQFGVLDFERDDARHAGEIRAVLRSAGTPIGPYDALIAGQARARQLVLVTHNLKEFRRVSGLGLEDWQS
jgi:tRNA(fMet)-specific endonuclease VapC